MYRLHRRHEIVHRVAGLLCPKGDPTERNLRQLIPFLSPPSPVPTLQSDPVPPTLPMEQLSQLKSEFLVLCCETACSFVLGGHLIAPWIFLIVTTGWEVAVCILWVEVRNVV